MTSFPAFAPLEKGVLQGSRWMSFLAGGVGAEWGSGFSV